MKIALAQINTTVGDFEGNTAKVLAYTKKAYEDGCDLVVFPEMTLPGYPPADLLGRRDFVQQNYLALKSVLTQIPQGIGVIVGFAEENLDDDFGKPLYNTMALLKDGIVMYKYHKRLLPDYDVYDETRYFEPGDISPPIDFGGLKLALTINQDAWRDNNFSTQGFYAQDPLEEMLNQGADVIINIAASPFNASQRLMRAALHQRLCKRVGKPMVFVNAVGGNDSLIFDGCSAAYNALGEIIAQASDFAQDMVTADFSVDKGEKHDVTGDHYTSLLKGLVLGTRDFVHKCGFSKGLVGLSGGIDSALVLLIGTLALGRENMHAVYMPSIYSAEENLVDTAEICKNLNVKLDAFSIGDTYQALAKQLAYAHLAPDFDPENPTVGQQNLQARLRGMLLMAYSNNNESLLLSTGNKSEIATGYCTLYGDMCGALAVLGDVYKTEVYELCNTINQMYGKTVIPQRIIDKAPSAELRPNQRDMDELPEYHELDLILRRYIEEHQTVNDLIAEGFPEKAVFDIARRIKNNEHKRFQTPPILRVSGKAFGRGRRYPIAQVFNPWELNS